MTNSTSRIPFTEILKSIPGFFGIRLEEEPRYEVLEEDGDIEVRHYAPALLAEVTIAGNHDEAIDEGFDVLAKYIFGGNAEHDELSMTTPVLQREATTKGMKTPVVRREATGAWTIGFFLGNDMSAAEAPTPIDPRVRLRLQSPLTVAVARYTGNSDVEKRDAARSAVLAWIDAHPSWAVVGDVFWAQYDAPFVIPFLKRNEAQVEVTRPGGG